MRLCEVAHALTSDLKAAHVRRKKLTEKQPLMWRLKVRNAQGSTRQVELPPITDAALRVNLAQRGYNQSLESLLSQDVPIIGMPIPSTIEHAVENTEAPRCMSTLTIREHLLTFFDLCAKQLEQVDPNMSAEFARATPSALRNAHISHSLGTDVAPRDVGRQLGLENINRVGEFRKKDVLSCQSGKDRMRKAQAFFALAVIKR